MEICSILVINVISRQDIKTLLKYIRDSVHGNVRYSCNRCDFKATWKQSLKEHIDTVHEKVQYSCNQCDYKVTTKKYLKRHIGTVYKDFSIVAISVQHRKDV